MSINTSFEPIAECCAWFLSFLYISISLFLSSAVYVHLSLFLNKFIDQKSLLCICMKECDV